MVGKTTFLLGWPIFRGFAVSFKSVDCWFPKIKTYWVFTAVSPMKDVFFAENPGVSAKGGRFQKVFLGLSETFMGFPKVLNPSLALQYPSSHNHGSVEKMGSPPSGSFLWFRVKNSTSIIIGESGYIGGSFTKTPTVVNSGGWDVETSMSHIPHRTVGARVAGCPAFAGWQTCQVQWLSASRGGGGRGWIWGDRMRMREIHPCLL